jgi:hypothetical protein
VQAEAVAVAVVAVKIEVSVPQMQLAQQVRILVSTNHTACNPNALLRARNRLECLHIKKSACN